MIDFDNKWDRKSFGMCKHAFLLAMFEKHLGKGGNPEEFDLKINEKIAEQLAEADMRILMEANQPKTKANIKEEDEDKNMLEFLNKQSPKDLF